MSLRLSTIQFWAIIAIAVFSIANLVVSVTINRNDTKVSVPTVVSFGDSGRWDSSNQPEWLKTPAWLPKD